MIKLKQLPDLFRGEPGEAVTSALGGGHATWTHGSFLFRSHPGPQGHQCFCAASLPLTFSGNVET